VDRLTDCFMVSTTVESGADADRLADAVVEARLAACVQQVPIRSTYRWEGKVEHASEVLLLMKTQRRRVDELMQFVRERHAYEVPELVVTAIEAGGSDYLAWIGRETGGA
jgi:periplasmic divalent cation tolerance protein